METEEFDQVTRAKMQFFVSLTILVFIAITGSLLVLFNIMGRNEEPITFDSLSTRCREDAGVILEGVNETNDGVSNHFAVCVPYEALTCIDLE